MSDEIRSDTGPFAMVPEWLLYSGVSGNAIKLFAIIHRHEGPGGAHPSRRRLGELMGASDDTIDRVLKELAEAGAVTIEARFDPAGDRTSNAYTLHFLRPGSRKSEATGGRGSEATGSRRSAAVTRTHMNENPLNEIPPTEVSPPAARVRRVAPLTDEQRAKLIADFGDLSDVSERIDLALSHRALGKSTNHYLYVRNWLRREREWMAERGPGGRGGKPVKPKPVFAGVIDAYSDAWAVSLWIVSKGAGTGLLEHQEPIAAEAVRQGLTGTEEILDLINGVVRA